MGTVARFLRAGFKGNRRDIINDVPDLLIIERHSKSGHWRPFNACINPSIQINRPPAPPVNPLRQIPRLNRIAPVVIQTAAAGNPDW